MSASTQPQTQRQPHACGPLHTHACMHAAAPACYRSLNPAGPGSTHLAHAAHARARRMPAICNACPQQTQNHQTTQHPARAPARAQERVSAAAAAAVRAHTRHTAHDSSSSACCSARALQLLLRHDWRRGPRQAGRRLGRQVRRGSNVIHSTKQLATAVDARNGLRTRGVRCGAGSQQGVPRCAAQAARQQDAQACSRPARQTLQGAHLDAAPVGVVRVQQEAQQLACGLAKDECARRRRSRSSVTASRESCGAAEAGARVCMRGCGARACTPPRRRAPGQSPSLMTQPRSPGL